MNIVKDNFQLSLRKKEEGHLEHFLKEVIKNFLEQHEEEAFVETINYVRD